MIDQKQLDRTIKRLKRMDHEGKDYPANSSEHWVYGCEISDINKIKERHYLERQDFNRDTIFTLQITPKVYMKFVCSDKKDMSQFI